MRRRALTNSKPPKQLIIVMRDCEITMDKLSDTTWKVTREIDGTDEEVLLGIMEASQHVGKKDLISQCLDHFDL